MLHEERDLRGEGGSPFLLGIANSVSGAAWRHNPPEAAQLEALNAALGGQDTLARVLAQRGISPDRLDAHLDPKLRTLMPDPSALRGMGQAVEEGLKALDAGAPIGMIADFDVDGATSGALLSRFLEACGAKVEARVPDRLREGYGPNAELFADLAQKGCRTVYTLDCGATATAALTAAQEMGLSVIVLDHHKMEAEAPPAAALVNPNQPGCESELGQLAAVGVTFMYTVALCRALRERGREVPDLLNFLDLVALGTLCDVVPLRGLNRALVLQGLKVWAQTQNPGLQALGRIAGLKNAPKPQDAGFSIGPRLNAPGRIGVSDLALRLLRADTQAEADALSLRLQDLNEQRKDIERDVYAEAAEAARAQVEAGAPLVLVRGPGWHPGVVGIVAGRLKERFNKPAIVLDQDPETGVLRGSGRSVPGVDLGAIVLAARAQGLLETGGGHAMAAGLGMRGDQFEAFQDFAITRLSEAADQVPVAAGAVQRELQADALVSLAGLKASLAERLERLGPFGPGNPEPILAVAQVYVTGVERMRGGHLRCFLKASDGSKTMKAMAFRADDKPLGQAMQSGRSQPYHALGTLVLNRWQGRENAEFHLLDLAEPNV